ncbi:MAG: NAD(P)-binding domain-containing protein, partial [Burkholderiaceae bacterium]
MRVGFVGLGAMGQPMAANIVKAGHTLRGFDVRAQALAELTAAGGNAVSSVSEASRDADLLWLMVVNGDQAEAVLFGDAPGSGGAAAALPRGALVVA